MILKLIAHIHPQYNTNYILVNTVRYLSLLLMMNLLLTDHHPRIIELTTVDCVKINSKWKWRNEKSSI